MNVPHTQPIVTIANLQHDISLSGLTMLKLLIGSTCSHWTMIRKLFFSLRDSGFCVFSILSHPPPPVGQTVHFWGGLAKLLISLIFKKTVDTDMRVTNLAACFYKGQPWPMRQVFGWVGPDKSKFVGGLDRIKANFRGGLARIKAIFLDAWVGPD